MAGSIHHCGSRYKIYKWGHCFSNVAAVELNCAVPYDLGNGEVGTVFVVRYKPILPYNSTEPLETRA